VVDKRLLLEMQAVEGEKSETIGVASFVGVAVITETPRKIE